MTAPTNGVGHDSRLPVFYTPEAVSQPASFSPSGYKPKLVTDSWATIFNDQIEVRRHGAFDPALLSHVHDTEYVLGVLRGQLTTGFGIADRAIAKSCLYTCGGVLAAAQNVLGNDSIGVACAPYSGFHHAGYDYGHGFCTFNGLVATAMFMVDTHQADRVLILDCDYHQGDGTQDILDRNGSDTTGSVLHWTAGEFYWQKSQAEDFFGHLKEVLGQHRSVDLVLYQAGADPHINDPLGGFLTHEQLRHRDRLVFEWAAKHQIPILWTLAGGYQQPLERVLKIHHATMDEALQTI